MSEKLYVVWIDTNLGQPDFGRSKWAENSEPKPLTEALKEVRECLETASESPAAIYPAGTQPTPLDEN